MHQGLSFGKSNRAEEVTCGAMVLNNGIGLAPHVKRHSQGRRLQTIWRFAVPAGHVSQP
jgi:hypothetical protein